MGLGLAALLHHFARTDGETLALAQLLSRPADQKVNPTPVEAFLSPDAWRELEARGDAPRGVEIVLTGGFEPPEGASGVLDLLAFNPKTGLVLASVEITVRMDDAGKSVAEAFDRVFREVGGQLDLGARIGDLDWEPLESVLYAERAALYDPLRAEPHDRLAALIHLGRAVEESPASRYPAGRLAHLALETAATGDRKLAEAGHRALSRAASDAPTSIELLEACAALELRFGGSVEAEAAALSALARAPKRSRLFALVSEARRMRGDRSGAGDILQQGFAKAGPDPVLFTERGMLCTEVEDMAGARGAWEEALRFEPIFAPAYLNLASYALHTQDETTGQKLVDRVLSASDSHPEVLRRALVLALAFEPEGLARAARIAKIGERLLAHSPGDAWTHLTTAHALARLGSRDEARRRFLHVEAVAGETSLAAEASRGRFELDDPQAAAEIETVVRGVLAAEARDLPALVVRSRALSAAHKIWMPRFALGVAERRTGNLQNAYRAFEDTIAMAPGCVEAHLELSKLAIDLDRPLDAVAHGEYAFKLAGQVREVLVVLARALACAGQEAEARAVLARLESISPGDANAREIAADMERGELAGDVSRGAPRRLEPEKSSFGARWTRFTERFRK